MSLWDFVKDLGDFFVSAAQEKQEKILKYKERYEQYPDDQELIRLYRTASPVEKKYGIGLVLKERGYGKSDLE
ncbi:MAG: hypothetical protein IKD27_08490 [Oscillospiraceae bacterium]|nr:hypothetical protein [Oscillospiraceae bacterium]